VTKSNQGTVTLFSGPKLQSIIPDSILNNNELNQTMMILPSNYNFEIHKTIWRLQESNSKRVAIQFPEGLLRYACIISDILEKFAKVEVVILGDVTYGACCIDDFGARALGCDFLVHYGHSCLIPIQQTSGITTLYVFVDIKIDVQHFVDTIKLNFTSPDVKMVLVGTVQFVSSLHSAKQLLSSFYKNIVIPQSKPLSQGEILGCTSPKINDECDVIIYLADGRFHLESIMISNPNIPAYKYDPYAKVFSREEYHFNTMKNVRKQSIDRAKEAKKVGLILGTLGRQGNLGVLNRLETTLKNSGKEYIIVLLSEIFPWKLDLFTDVDAWIQIACPRLSIDWGYAFKKPLLNPYEAQVAFGIETWEETSYPMDFYSKTGGNWTVYYQDKKETIDDEINK